MSQQAGANHEFCKYCRLVTYVIEDRHEGAYICSECGSHLDTFFDMRSEWRTFSNDTEQADRSRAGQAEDTFLSTASNLSTILQNTGGEKHKYLIKAHNKTAIAQADKNFKTGLKEMQRLAELMQLKNRVLDLAKSFLNAVEKNMKTPQCSIQGLAAASLVLATRKDGIPWQMKTVAKLAGLQTKEMGRCIKVLNQSVKGKVSSNIGDYMARFCTHLRLPQSVTNHAEKIATLAKKDGLCGGRSPTSVVAAAIYMACQCNEQSKDKTRKEIGEVVSVSETTIKLAYKSLYENRKLFVFDDIPDSIKVESLINGK